MIVLDTSVLVYAVGAEHPLREPCRAILTAGRRGELTLATTVEVVQEFLHVRARRRTREDAVTLARAYAKALTPLIVATSDDLHLAFEVFRRTRLGAFDALLAAVALNHEAEALVSADAAFGEVPGLPYLEPVTLVR